jgi:hypothetical protein
MRNRVLVLAAIAACSGPRPKPPRGEVVFSVTGRVHEGPYRFGREDLPGLPRRTFRSVGPGGGGPMRFEGVAVYTLLQDAVDVEDDADVVVFHGREGFRAAVPVGVLRELRPVLADRVDGAPVARWRAEAAPLVLAWPNLDMPGIDSDPRMRWWWVPGVTTVELVSWTATYGRVLAVPRGAGDDARLGAGVVGTQCMGCHRVRGVGGTRGPELTGHAAERGLEALGASVRSHAKLVGSASAPDASPAAIRQVDAFLRAVDRAGTRREDTDSPPEPASPPRPPSRPRGP